MSYHINHIISIMSYQSYHILSYIISYYIILYQSYYIISVISYIISIMSYQSYHIIYHIISYIISYYIILYQSYHITSIMLYCINHIISFIIVYHINHVISHHVSIFRVGINTNLNQLFTMQKITKLYTKYHIQKSYLSSSGCISVYFGSIRIKFSSHAYF